MQGGVWILGGLSLFFFGGSSVLKGFSTFMAGVRFGL